MNWNNKEEVLAAVSNSGEALEFASDELRADKEAVLAAVKQSDKAFRYVSDELKADKDVVIAALTHKQEWLSRYSVEELLEVIKRNGNTLEPLSDLVYVWLH
jgi:hypothetical protein